MAHRNAHLTEFGRVLLVQRHRAQLTTSSGSREPWLVAGHGLQVAGALPRRGPSWAGRSELAGPALPPRPARPSRSVASWAARWRHRQSRAPAWLPPGMPRSTVYGVLRRYGMSRLARMDRVSGVVVPC
jgi:hypothetical protein